MIQEWYCKKKLLDASHLNESNGWRKQIVIPNKVVGANQILEPKQGKIREFRWDS